MEKATGAQGTGSNQHQVRSHDETAPTLADLGISKSQSSRRQKLAEVPEAEFEATFARPEKPSTSGVFARAGLDPRKRNVVDDPALWLWGRLLDFERKGLLEEDPSEVCRTMLDHMRETVRELALRVSEWLGAVGHV
ncbi:MAG: hypothetical protein ACREE9_10520 [Stellaceae bacterium]